MKQLWSDGEDARLTFLWAEGHSAAVIGADPVIGKSRNAVIGRARRLKLESHKAIPRPRKDRISRYRPQKAEKPKKPEPQEPMPESAVKFMQLDRHHCRFPLGGPKEPAIWFCGERKVTGESYCSWHCRIAYTPSRAPQPYIQFRKSA